MHLHFTVFGTPQPQGSMNAFIPKGWTRPIVTSTNKELKQWRNEVGAVAAMWMRKEKFQMVESVPVMVTAIFQFVRPKSIKKNIKYKFTKPDCDKLARGLL